MSLPEYMETIHRKGDKNIKSVSHPEKRKEKRWSESVKEKEAERDLRGRGEGEKIRAADGYIMNWRSDTTTSGKLARIKLGDSKGMSEAYQEY